MMAPLKHGHTRRTADGRVDSPEYRAYTAMKNRCLNEKQARYKDYGGRGITICRRWLEGENGLSGFQCFLADVGQKPGPGHSLDRRNNDRGYYPGNVRWATRAEQARNTRQTRLIDVCGVEIPLVDAVRRWGQVPYTATQQRLRRNWSSHDAIFVPKGGKPGDAEPEPLL